MQDKDIVDALRSINYHSVHGPEYDRVKTNKIMDHLQSTGWQYSYDTEAWEHPKHGSFPWSEVLKDCWWFEEK